MPSGFEKGDLIDDAYEVIERIGEGGFGDVYRVRQLSMSRDVALKILLQKGEDSEHLAGRFRREVLAVRNLSHPNTVRIFDFSETPDGYLYYTMEYLEGKTLTQRIRETEGVGAEEARDVLVQVLKSLSEAHSRGIVHRDLKPGNVMLADVHGETNFVKVLDFGIAKAAHTGSDDLPEEQLTSSENIVGTLRYMAPEQAKDAPIGPYTDLYTLGLVGLELLTGEKVFAGLSNVQILKEQLSPEPIDIPGRLTESPLGAVLRQALAKEIDARYQKADSMREALEEISVEALEKADGPERANTVPIESDLGSERDTDSAETVQEVDPSEESDVDQTRPDTGESEPSNPPPIPGPSEQEEGGAVEREDSPDSDELETIPPDTGPEDAPAETKATEKVDENQLEKLRESVADGEVPEEIRETAAEGGAVAAGARDRRGAERAAASDSTTEDAAPNERMVARQGADTTDFTPGGFSRAQIAAAAGLVGIFAFAGVYLLWSGPDGEGAGAEESAVAGEADATSIFGGGVASEDAVRSDDQPGDVGGPKKTVTVTSPDSEAEIEVYRDGELLGSTPVEVDVDGEVELSLKSGEAEKSIRLTPDSSRTREVAMSSGASSDGDSGPDAVSEDVTSDGEEEKGDESAPSGSKSGSASPGGSGSRSPSPSRGGSRSPKPTPTPSPSPEPDEPSETESAPSEPSGSDETTEEDEEEDDGMEVPVFQ